MPRLHPAPNGLGPKAGMSEERVNVCEQYLKRR
jgi:hypothetical protein